MISFMHDWDKLIELIENYMREENITRAEFARRSGISQPHVTKLLDRKSPPGRLTLERIAKTLRLKLGDVYTIAGWQPPEGGQLDLVEKSTLYLLSQLSDDEKRELFNHIEFDYGQILKRRDKSNSESSS